MSPQQVYEQYRKDPLQDMYEYSPLLKFRAKGDILEIGVRGGVSTAAFLLGLEANGGHLYSIDLDPGCGNLFDHPQWSFLCADSRDVERVTSNVPARLDVLFVDGDHRYSGLKADLNNYSPLVKPGGLILVHDIVPMTPEKCAETCCAWEDSRLAYQEFVMQFGKPHFDLPGQFGMGMIYA